MILALIGISCPVFWLGQVTNLITQGGLQNRVQLGTAAGL